MHRDKKVGLALAILLCSIVGAFFFRDDTRRNNGPELKDPQQLDREIAHSGRQPYSEPDSKSRNGEARRTDASRKGFDPNDLPDFLRDNSSGQSSAQRSRVNASRDPFAPDNRDPKSSDLATLTPPPHDTPAVPIPLHNSEWDIASNDGATARRRGTDVNPALAGQTRTHTVAVGETLSSIAGKYLGSQARYQEIFQANRDQLKSPDDLKVGMKLSIPDRAETRSTSGTRSTVTQNRSSTEQTRTPRSNTPTGKVTERSSEPAETNDSASRKPKFKPAKSGPSIRRTTDASEEEPTGKTLSQLPPRGLLEVDEELLAELDRDSQERVTNNSTTDAEVARLAQAAKADDLEETESASN